jgi:hypothetical protein
MIFIAIDIDIPDNGQRALDFVDRGIIYIQTVNVTVFHVNSSYRGMAYYDIFIDPGSIEIFDIFTIGEEYRSCTVDIDCMFLVVAGIEADEVDIQEFNFVFECTVGKMEDTALKSDCIFKGTVIEIKFLSVTDGHEFIFERFEGYIIEVNFLDSFYCFAKYEIFRI